jgi:hypothetical protein
MINNLIIWLKIVKLVHESVSKINIILQPDEEVKIMLCLNKIIRRSSNG